VKSLLTTILSLFIASTAQAQTILPDVVKFDHTWVKGLYWNPGELPGWGIFADVQEETMFGAVYGYKNGEPSFVILLGSAVSTDPLIFEGDVYFVIEPGVREEDVGNFRWEATDDGASPAARLKITSNILDRTNLSLVRTSYVETDKVDMLTGGDWNIVRRVSISTYGDHYSISDTRMDQDGITFAAMTDFTDTEKIGLAAYFPPDRGDVYAMMMQFTATTDAFYVFYANNTDMYGRYWLLDDGESPTGNGFYFRGSVDTMQEPYSGSGGGNDLTAQVEAVSDTGSRTDKAAQENLRAFETSMYSETKESLNQQFTEQSVQMAFEKLKARLKSKETQME
jgi:hypothetical protein